MPTINSITLPDGVTYDFEAQAENWEVVPIKFYDSSQEEQEFNALEIQLTESEGVTTTLYSINAPDGSTLWSWNNTNDTLNTSKDVQINGSLYPKGGIFTTSAGLPERNGHSYLLGIDAFSEGGQMKWSAATNVTVGNASKLGGYAPSASATANTVVLRQANGYIYAVYYNSSNGAENIASYTNPLVMFADASGWQRKTSLVNFKSWLGLTDSGTKTLNATYKCYYRKVNGMCTVSVDYRATVSSTITVGTLPSGYRPHTTLMAANATGGGNSSYLQIDTGGVVKLAKVGSGGYCIATITYPGF